MRSLRFVLLAITGMALAGCMQTGGPSILSRDSPPPWKQQLALPAMLRPAPVRVAQPVYAQPMEVEPIAQAPLPLEPQVVAMAVEEPSYTLDSGDRLRVVVF